jgi:hypothetical protein
VGTGPADLALAARCAGAAVAAMAMLAVIRARVRMTATPSRACVQAGYESRT